MPAAFERPDWPRLGAKPLYLHHGSVVGLDLDDAQRLCIERREAPLRHIPLHLVSRLVCNSHTDIRSRVWLACMRQGVPLVVVAADGQALGWSLGARRTESSMRQLLLHALDDPDWDALYGEWHARQHAALSVQNLLLCHVPSTAEARQHPRQALCNAHFVKHKRPCGEAVNALAALAQHELAACLALEVGEPDLLAWYRPGLNLIESLGRLLGLHGHTDVHHAPLLPAEGTLDAWAMRFYERHAAHWQQRLAHLLTGFEQFLREHWQ